MEVLQHKTLRERIYQEIVKLIVAGELPGGAPIDERQMIDRLSVSRTPFREAIGTLAKEGLVEIKPYKGFYVRSFTLQEVSDLFAVRGELEAFAARLAVKQATADDLMLLERLLDEGVAALRRRDMPTYAERDRSFHEEIARMSGNRTLIETLSRLDLQIRVCRVIANEDKTFADDAALERDRIVQAFRDKDEDKAAELMRAHIAHAGATVLTRYQEKEASPSR